MSLNNFHDTVSWSQFTQLSSRPSDQNEDAQIHPDMSFSNFKLGKKGKSVVITVVDINISLVPDDCWVVTKQMTSDLLKHEQGHYDILALSAREFYNKLIGLSAKSTHDLQTTVSEEQKKIAQRVKKVDGIYDARTDHSQKKQVQQTWDQSIEAAKKNPKGTTDDLPQ